MRDLFQDLTIYIPVGFHSRLPSSITLTTLVETILISTTFFVLIKRRLLEIDRALNSCRSHSYKPLPTSVEGVERESGGGGGGKGEEIHGEKERGFLSLFPFALFLCPREWINSSNE